MVGFDSSASDKVAQEFPRTDAEGAFGGIESQLVLSQNFKHFLKVGQMFLVGLTLNNHVVNVGFHVWPS